MLQTFINTRWSWPLILLLLVSLSACGTIRDTVGDMSNTEKGAAAGAGAGAVVGGVVGWKLGSTAKGAIVGAVVGGTAGAVIGQRMDKQAAELEDELEDAEVQRVGEGIAVRFDSGLLFDFNSADLRSNARENLRSLADNLTKYPETDVLIVGHTDAVGSDSYNMELSQRRAESAARYLASLGIDRSRVTTLGRGESEPIASNDDDSGRQQNRRVEVAIFASEEYRDEISQQY